MLETEYWIKETRCRRCDSINEWGVQLYFNSEEENAEQRAKHHIEVHIQDGDEVKYCDNCDLKTRQEWVTIYKEKD